MKPKPCEHRFFNKDGKTWCDVCGEVLRDAEHYGGQLAAAREALVEARRCLFYSAVDLRRREGAASVLCELIEEEAHVVALDSLLAAIDADEPFVPKKLLDKANEEHHLELVLRDQLEEQGGYAERLASIACAWAFDLGLNTFAESNKATWAHGPGSQAEVAGCDCTNCLRLVSDNWPDFVPCPTRSPNGKASCVRHDGHDGLHEWTAAPLHLFGW